LIIERIRVLNFASYEEATLDFRKLGNTVFVHGSTGAGKTTFFIDSQTLALFGKAYGEESREASKWVVPPLSRGATFIQLDFRVGGTSYRVIRKLSSPERSWEARLSRLDDDGREVAVVASGVRSVDKLIREMTGLDFSTYLSTVVVRQGEVSKIISRGVRPSERREIFLKAFRISFSKYRDKAGSLLRETRDKLSRVEAELEILRKKAEEADALREELGKLTFQLESLERRLRIVENMRNKLKGEIKALRENIHGLSAKLSILKERERLLAKLKAEFRVKKSEVERLKASPGDLKKLEAEASSIRRQIEALRNVIPILEEYWKTRYEYERTSSDVEKLQDRLLKLEEVKARVEELKKLASGLDELAEKRSKLEEEVARVKDSVSRISERIRMLEASIDALTRSGEVSRCPVCNRSLSRLELEKVLRHLRSELNSERDRLHGEVLRLKLLESKRLKLEEQYSNCKSAFDRLKEAEDSLKTMKPVEKDFVKALERLKTLEERLEEVKKKVQSAIGYVKTLKEVSLEIERLTNRLDCVNRMLRGLYEVGSKIALLEKDLDELGKTIEELELELKNLEPVRNEYQKTLDKLQRLEEEFRKCDEEYSSLNREVGVLKGSISKVQEELRKAKEASVRIKALEKERLNLKRYETVYRILYNEVFHDRGLPLSLLREFLSSVEAWSRMYLQRFLPGKDVRIRVDEEGRISIEVLDGSTVRNLSTYSGGESTLIGFAIRLGIAKAIAEKALATTPKMLIIDEGFGPLSSEFREEVLKTLSELRKDYDKIIVISHVEDIRESPYFDSYIRVYRDHRGLSRLEVLT